MGYIGRKNKFTLYGINNGVQVAAKGCIVITYDSEEDYYFIEIFWG